MAEELGLTEERKVVDEVGWTERWKEKADVILWNERRNSMTDEVGWTEGRNSMADDVEWTEGRNSMTDEVGWTEGRNSMADEVGWAGGRNSMADEVGWTEELIYLPDEELIQKFKDDDTLIDKSIIFYCLSRKGTDHCPCARNLELLSDWTDDGLDCSLKNLQVSYRIGCCPHARHALCNRGQFQELDDLFHTNLTHSFSTEDTEVEILLHKQRLEEVKGENVLEVEKAIPLAVKSADQIVRGDGKMEYYLVPASAPVINLLSAKGRIAVIKSLVYDSSINLGFLKIEMGTFQKSSLHSFMPVHLTIEHGRIDLLKFYLYLLGDAYFHLIESTQHGHIILFTVKRNNLAALRLLLKRYKKLRNGLEFDKILKLSLACAFYHKTNCSILKYLIKKGARLHSKVSIENSSAFAEMVVKNLIESVVSEGDPERFSYAVQAKMVDNDIRYTLERIVFNDHERLLQVLVHQRRKLVQPLISCELCIQAVINNNPGILRSLLDTIYNSSATNLRSERSRGGRKSDVISGAMRYAELLRHADCCDVLRKKSRMIKVELSSSDTQLEFDVFKFESRYEKRADMLQRMIDNGYKVENDSSNNMLGQALTVRDHQSVRVLLFADADPFPVSPLWDRYLRSEGYLLDLVYCNVDLKDKLSKLLQYQETYDRTIMNAMFVLKSVHTLSRSDREFLQLFSLAFERLNERRTTGTQSSLHSAIDCINLILHAPQSLQVLCRNALRRKFQRKHIFQLVEKSGLPSKLSRFVLLDDITNLFRGTLEPERQTSHLTNDIERISRL